MNWNISLWMENNFVPVLADTDTWPTEKDARTLFVKNLPFSATADDLKEIFKDAVEIRVPPGQNTSNKG